MQIRAATLKQRAPGFLRGLPAIALLLLPIHALAAGPPTANTAELQQLNRASEQELRSIQRPPRGIQPPPPTTPDNAFPWRERLESGQLQRLQEQQRIDLLKQHHRNKVIPQPAWRQQLDGIHQQYRFEQQQRQMLNRFHLQGGLPPR